MPSFDPVMLLLQELAAAKGYRLEPMVDIRAEETDMDRLCRALKAMPTAKLHEKVKALREHLRSLRSWQEKFTVAYRLKAKEYSETTLPGADSPWPGPQILREEIEFAEAAVRNAEEILADRLAREAACEVLQLPIDDDPVSYLTCDVFELLDLERPTPQEVPDAAA